jgi:regulator of ribosome biosynthesis
MSENEKKRQQNIARAGPRQERKMEIEKTLATTKISTASMGKFDKRLDGEKKIHGVKRKVRSNGKNIFLKIFI